MTGRQLCGSISLKTLVFQKHALSSCPSSRFQVYLQAHRAHIGDFKCQPWCEIRLWAQNVTTGIDCPPWVECAVRSRHRNAAAKSKKMTSHDVISQSPADESLAILFIFMSFSSCVISTVEWRAGGKHKARPKHQITGSKMKPYGFSLHFSIWAKKIWSFFSCQDWKGQQA